MSWSVPACVPISLSSMTRFSAVFRTTIAQSALPTGRPPVTRTRRMVTFGAVTLISPVMSRFSMTMPGLSALTEALGVRTVPRGTPVERLVGIAAPARTGRAVAELGRCPGPVRGGRPRYRRGDGAAARDQRADDDQQHRDGNPGHRASMVWRVVARADSMVACQEPCETVTVVVPAHNEGAGIRRLLDALTAPVAVDGLGRLEVVVVCNGLHRRHCRDRAEATATSRSSRSRNRRRPLRWWSVTTPPPARTGRTSTRTSSSTVPGWLLCSPRSTVGSASLRQAGASAMAGAGLGVRWYYDVWVRLPSVESGVFGRGVVVLSPEGNGRVRALPRVMSDDLAASEAFQPGERRVLDSVQAVIDVPRTMADLVRRRIRIATGNAQLDGLGLRSDEARTKLSDLGRIAVTGPTMPVKVVALPGRDGRRAGRGSTTDPPGRLHDLVAGLEQPGALRPSPGARDHVEEWLRPHAPVEALDRGPDRLRVVRALRPPRRRPRRSRRAWTRPPRTAGRSLYAAARPS